MKVDSIEQLEKLASEKGFEIKQDVASKKLTFKKIPIDKEKRETKKRDDQNSALLQNMQAMLAQNQELLAKLSETEQPTGLIPEQTFSPTPRKWHCQVQRDQKGFIESFTLEPAMH
jgi:hypothetical protein